MRPICRMFYQAVLHRIEMCVVHMSSEVAIVADCVLPITTLPDAAFATAGHDW